MWHIGGGAKQSTCHGDPSLTVDSQIEHERHHSIQGVPKKCIYVLNCYNSIELLILTNKYIDRKERIHI